MARLLLDAVTTAATGNSVKQGKYSMHTLVVTYTNVTGTMSDLKVDLEGSIDDSTFFTLGSIDFTPQELTDLKAVLTVSDHLVNYVRAKVNTATSSGTYTITAKYEGGGNYA